MSEQPEPSFADGWCDGVSRARQKMLNNLRPQLANYALSCDESGYARAHPLEFPVNYTPKRVPKARFPTDNQSAYARGWRLALKEVPLRMARMAARSCDLRVAGLWVDDNGRLTTQEAARLLTTYLAPAWQKHGSLEGVPRELMMEVAEKSKALLKAKSRDARLARKFKQAAGGPGSSS